jgi:hypothetical protein
MQRSNISTHYLSMIMIIIVIIISIHSSVPRSSLCVALCTPYHFHLSSTGFLWASPFRLAPRTLSLTPWVVSLRAQAWWKMDLSVHFHCHTEPAAHKFHSITKLECMPGDVRWPSPGIHSRLLLTQVRTEEQMCYDRLPMSMWTSREADLAIIVKLHIRSQYRWSPALLRAPHARGKQSTSRGIKAQRVYSEDTLFSATFLLLLYI